MATTHYVKSWSFLFDAIKSGQKKHDIRDLTERDYKVGDYMILKRFDQATGSYTGEELKVKITYITDRRTPCAFSSAVLHRDFGILSIEVEPPKPLAAAV